MSTTATNKLVTKIYHLVDNGQSSIEHYRRVNQNQRIRINDRPVDRPALQITFTDVEGINRTIRFKLNCNEIYQDVQIEKYKIPANEKFTDAERAMLLFKNGVLVVTNPVAHKFLEAHPENENFKGECLDIQKKLFREYDPAAKKNEEVQIFRRRLAAANKVADMELADAQDMLLRIYGSAYRVPDNLNDCVTQLIAFMDETDDEGIEEILREGKTLEDEIKILVGKALKNGSLSFEEPGMENFVVKKKGSQVIPLKEISANLPANDRRRIFSEFLASSDGTLHLQDLRTLVGTQEKEESKETKTAASGKEKEKTKEAVTA